jgi:uncharacterized protein
VVGGLNWLLVGLFQFDLVAAIFGSTVGTYSGLSRVIFVIVGLDALYGLTLFKPLTIERNRANVIR